MKLKGKNLLTMKHCCQSAQSSGRPEKMCPTLSNSVSSSPTTLKLRIPLCGCLPSDLPLLRRCLSDQTHSLGPGLPHTGRVRGSILGLARLLGSTNGDRPATGLRGSYSSQLGLVLDPRLTRPRKCPIKGGTPSCAPILRVTLCSESECGTHSALGKRRNEFRTPMLSLSRPDDRVETQANARNATKSASNSSRQSRQRSR